MALTTFPFQVSLREGKRLRAVTGQKNLNNCKAAIAAVCFSRSLLFVKFYFALARKPDISSPHGKALFRSVLFGEDRRWPKHSRAIAGVRVLAR